MPDAGRAMTMHVLASEGEVAGSDILPEGGREITAEDEALPTKVIARPGMPTQAEIERHRIDHIPYRSWCPECVE